MKQWDVYKFPYPDEDRAHYCVIISPDEFCAQTDILEVNALICVSVTPMDRNKKLHEVFIPEGEIFTRKTAVKCLPVHLFKKADAAEYLGNLGRLQRGEIGQTIGRLLRI